VHPETIAGVRAVVLFGSAARGDDDAHSDRDVCAIVDDFPDRDVARVKMKVAAAYETDALSVSLYRVKTAAQMAKLGSLFLWHLKLEGQVLFERRGAFRRLVENLRAYDSYSDDLLRFQEVFDDTAASLHETKRFDLFDLHALFLVVRNVSMLFTVRSGTPSFGRSSAHSTAVRLFGRLPVSAADYNYLMRGHLIYSRGADLFLPRSTKKCTTKVLAHVSSFLSVAWRELT